MINCNHSNCHLKVFLLFFVHINYVNFVLNIPLYAKRAQNL